MLRIKRSLLPHGNYTGNLTYVSKYVNFDVYNLNYEQHGYSTTTGYIRQDIRISDQEQLLVYRGSYVSCACRVDDIYGSDGRNAAVLL